MFNADMGETLEEESRKVPPRVLEEVFWAVAETDQQLDRNVDLRLALEAMSLSLASIVKGRAAAAV